MLNVKNVVDYGPSFGVNLIFGGELKLNLKVPLLVTMDGIVTFGTDYSYDKHTEDGVEMAPFPDWEKVGSSQLQFNLGLKYYI